MASRFLAPLVVASLACSAHPASAPDAGAPAEDAPAFTPADHGALPTIPNRGGPIVAHLELVTVTFPSYAYASDVASFGDWIVGSTWLSAVCQAYGCGPGTHVGKIALSSAAPATVTPADIETLLTSLVHGGTLPAPTNDTVYALYFPSTTEVDPNPGSNGCATGGAFHSAVSIDGQRAIYAAVPDCSSSPAMKATFPDLSPLEGIEETASHEIIEAMTDPAGPETPAWFFADANDPWFMLGGEAADWCVGHTMRESGFVATRVWSNDAASGGAAPCVPSTSDPFVDVSAPSNVIHVKAGGTAELTLTGWSSAATDPWSLEAFSPPPMPGTFDAHATLSANVVGNGQTVTLTVSAAANVTNNSRALVIVGSKRGAEAFNPWPLLVQVP